MHQRYYYCSLTLYRYTKTPVGAFRAVSSYDSLSTLGRYLRHPVALFQCLSRGSAINGCAVLVDATVIRPSTMPPVLHSWRVVVKRKRLCPHLFYVNANDSHHHSTLSSLSPFLSLDIRRFVQTSSTQQHAQCLSAFRCS